MTSRDALEKEANDHAMEHTLRTLHYKTSKRDDFVAGYLQAAIAREQEIEALRKELATVTEQRDALPKYHGRAVEGLMILHDRKDLQDLADLRCGDFMANAVPHLVAEIDRLRARVAELEGMVPRWCELGDEARTLTERGWHQCPQPGSFDFHSAKLVLMVPPIPLPEEKEGKVAG